MQNKKVSRKIISLALSLLMLLSLIPSMSLMATGALSGITYLEWNSQTKQFAEATCSNYTVMTNNTTTFTKNTCYVVNSDVTISSKITLQGAKNAPVRLILCDGATLNANGGIESTFDNANNHLYIYAQSTGTDMGSLNVSGVGIQYRNLTINGGNITTSGSQHGINGAGSVTINGGNITTSGPDGIQSQGSVTINGGTVNATSTGTGSKPTGIYVYDGITGTGGQVTINGGAVTVSGGKWGVYASNKNNTGSFTINDGTLTASGSMFGISTKTVAVDSKLTVKAGNAAPGTDVTATFTSEYGHLQKWVQIAPHIHNFTYSANNDTITATCNEKGCGLTDGKVTLTISAEDATYDSNPHGATLDSAAWTAAGLTAPTIKYTGRENTTYAESETAPTNAGDYTASITVDTDKTATVNYTIAKADPTYTAPTGLSATYGDTLASVDLPEGWTWADNTLSVGDAGSKSFNAVFTPDNTDNYNIVENIAVTVAVNPANITPSVSIENWKYGEDASTPSVEGNEGDGEVTYTYATKGSDNFSSNVPENVGEYTVKAEVAETLNYNSATVTADFKIEKGDLTPTVIINNRTYGDKANDPSVEGNLGNGTVTYTYAPKGSEEFVSEAPVDAGEYTVKAEIAETESYNAAVATADFEVEKATLTVIARNKTIAYGEAIPQDWYVIKGLLGEDTAKVTLKPSIAENAIVPFVKASDNYEVVTVNGLLGIKGSPTANALPSGKNIIVNFSTAKNADGYMIYAGYCGSGSYPLAKTIKGNSTNSFTLTKIGGKAIDTTKNVFLYVVAYKNVNGKKITIVRSASVRVAASDSKYTNAKSVTVNKTAVTLNAGKQTTIKAQVTPANAKKTLLAPGAELNYVSANKSVATVDANGKITAVAKGAANIYVYAQNGKKAKVAVTVK